MKNLQSYTRKAWSSALLLLLSLSLFGEIAAAQTGRSNGDQGSHLSEGRIVVYVWEATSSVSEDSGGAVDPKLSRDFAASGLEAMAMLRDWQSHLSYSIRNGYPLSESWIAVDRQRADDALRQAALRTSTEADRIAIRPLVNQFEDLRRWSNGLLEANRNLRLAEYYMSPAALENDPLFQKTSACGSFLASMLASGRLAEDASCQ